MSESNKIQTRKMNSKLACYENALSLSYCFTAQKMKFSINNLFSKCDQIRSFLRIWPHLLKKSVMEDFIFCAVKDMGELRKDFEKGESDLAISRSVNTKLR